MSASGLSLPGLAEVGWYVLIRRMRRWAAELPEAEMMRRSATLADRVSAALGRPREPVAAMLKGLACTVFFRHRGISVVDRLTDRAHVRWRAFLEESRGVNQAVYVTAHMGPFQLQMDLLALTGQPKVLIYRSYRWGRLRREIDRLRLKADRFEYIDMRRTRDLAAMIGAGQSPAFVGDVPKRSRRSLRLFGEPTLDDLPVRLSLRHSAPIFLGGLYTEDEPNGGPGIHRFGVAYTRVDPSDFARTARAYESAMETYIGRNPMDWIRGF